MSAGPQGLIGPRGHTGRDGDEGPQGPRGNDGERGQRGEPGRRGDVGDRGPQGDKGKRGASGDRGERGPRGERGEAAKRVPRDAGSTDLTGPTLPRPPSAGLMSTHGHVSFAEINALTPERLAQFDTALVAFVKKWLSPTLSMGYEKKVLTAAFSEFMAEYGVLFSLTDAGLYLDRGRNLGVPLGVRVGSFMAYHATKLVDDGHYQCFICLQITHDLLVFRGLETTM